MATVKAWKSGEVGAPEACIVDVKAVAAGSHGLVWPHEIPIIRVCLKGRGIGHVPPAEETLRAGD